MLIRPATPADCSAIAGLWNPVIRDSDATFNSQQKTAEMLAGDLADKAARDHPFLLAVNGSTILGFATYGQFRASNGYCHTMENTIILAPAGRGLGTGRALMQEIEDHARGRGVRSIIAGISHRNRAGIAFHSAIGYVEIARLPQVGFKFDQWYDLVLMQKILSPHPRP